MLFEVTYLKQSCVAVQIEAATEEEARMKWSQRDFDNIQEYEIIKEDLLRIDECELSET